MQMCEDSASGKCPITFALEIFGDKWSLIIIRDILFKKKKYYGEFLESSEKISTNILASRLQKLDAEGILTKTKDAENLTKYIYRLTQKGKDLIPLMLEMVKWSVRYDPQSGVPSNIINGAPANLLRRLHKDRALLIDEILDKLENEQV